MHEEVELVTELKKIRLFLTQREERRRKRELRQLIDLAYKYDCSFDAETIKNIDNELKQLAVPKE